MKYYVYILKMIDGRFYTGITNNPHRREDQHGVNPSTRTTHIFGAGQVLFSEAHPDQPSALKREHQLKKWSHAKKEALVRGDMVKLKALAKRKKY